MEERSFYSIAEVANKVGLSQKSIRRYIASGELGATKIGSTYRIPVSALNTFINKDNIGEKKANYDVFGNVVDDSFSSRKLKLILFILTISLFFI